jgi:protocatechuate 3,4-dioxygenase beta subunit
MCITLTLAGCTQPQSTLPNTTQIPTATPIITGKTACGLTGETAAGPYYIQGAPELIDGNLNYANLPGRRLDITGFVYTGLDDTNPIANAVLDIWQTDTEGMYHPDASGSIDQFEKSQIALRGTVSTNEEGYYQFTTIYPGEYPGRTRHIHVKVRAPGHDELTTQLIIPGLEDRSIDFDEGSQAQSPPACHLLEIYDELNPAYATFNFRLKS